MGFVRVMQVVKHLCVHVLQLDAKVHAAKMTFADFLFHKNSLILKDFKGQHNILRLGWKKEAKPEWIQDGAINFNFSPLQLLIARASIFFSTSRDTHNIASGQKMVARLKLPGVGSFGPCPNLFSPSSERRNPLSVKKDDVWETQAILLFFFFFF